MPLALEGLKPIGVFPSQRYIALQFGGLLCLKESSISASSHRYLFLIVTVL